MEKSKFFGFYTKNYRTAFMRLPNRSLNIDDSIEMIPCRNKTVIDNLFYIKIVQRLENGATYVTNWSHYSMAHHEYYIGIISGKIRTEWVVSVVDGTLHELCRYSFETETEMVEFMDKLWVKSGKKGFTDFQINKLINGKFN